jgi:hypothetical protein
VQHRLHEDDDMYCATIWVRTAAAIRMGSGGR